MRVENDGDHDDFDAAVGAHRPALVAHCARRFGADAAEDLAQETMLRAFLAWDRYDRTRPLRPWLLSIARNVAIDRSRATRVRDRAAATVEVDPAIRPSTIAPDHADAVAERAALHGAVQRLPHRQRRALVARAMEGMSVAEVADTAQLSEGAVEQLLVRARRTARDAYVRADRHLGAVGVLLADRFRVRRRGPGLRGGSWPAPRVCCPRRLRAWCSPRPRSS